MIRGPSRFSRGSADRWATDRAIASERLTKLLRAFGNAELLNPYDRPLLAGVTFAASAATDNTLAAAIPLASGGVLSSASQNNIAWYGGKPIPTQTGTKYVALPSTSRAPSNGNLAGYTGIAGVIAAMDMWGSALEVETPGDVVELGAVGRAQRMVQCLVNDQFVQAKGGVAGAQAGNADNFFKVSGLNSVGDFNKVTFLFGPDQNDGVPTIPYQLRLSVGASIRMPSQAAVLSMDVFGDSFVEGIVATALESPYLTPNGPMIQVMAEVLGIKNIRQRGVGGTGILASGATPGTRPTLRQKIEFALNPTSALFCGVPDAILDLDGFNDYAFYLTPELVQTEFLACLRLYRQYCPHTPIIVGGSISGARGAGAPLTGTIAIENAKRLAVEQFADLYCKFMPMTTDLSGAWLANPGNSTAYISQTEVPPTHLSNIANGGGARYYGRMLARGVRTTIKAMVPT